MSAARDGAHPQAPTETATGLRTSHRPPARPTLAGEGARCSTHALKKGGEKALFSSPFFALPTREKNKRKKFFFLPIPLYGSWLMI
jgi:hypothetical protein